MVERAGWGNAMRILLTGEEFDAEEAHRCGFVQIVCEPGEERRGARREPYARGFGEEAALGDERPVAVEKEGVEEGPALHFPPTAFRIASVNEASVWSPERRAAIFPSRP